MKHMLRIFVTVCLLLVIVLAFTQANKMDHWDEDLFSEDVFSNEDFVVTFNENENEYLTSVLTVTSQDFKDTLTEAAQLSEVSHQTPAPTATEPTTTHSTTPTHTTTSTAEPTTTETAPTTPAQEPATELTTANPTALDTEEEVEESDSAQRPKKQPRFVRALDTKADFRPTRKTVDTTFPGRPTRPNANRFVVNEPDPEEIKHAKAIEKQKRDAEAEAKLSPKEKFDNLIEKFKHQDEINKKKRTPFEVQTEQVFGSDLSDLENGEFEQLKENAETYFEFMQESVKVKRFGEHLSEQADKFNRFIKAMNKGSRAIKMTADLQIPQLDHDAAMLCKEIYDPEKNGDFNHDYQTVFSEESGFFRVVKNDQLKYAIVVFRGNPKSSQMTWISNLPIKYTTCPFGEKTFKYCGLVLTDFWEKYSTHSARVIEKVLPFIDANYRFVVTGYNVGAAYATLAALDIKEHYKQRVRALRLVTFGSPRVGSPLFASRVFHEVPDSVRYVHVTRYADRDLLTLVPPKALNFAHVIRPVFIPCRIDNPLFCNEINEYIETVKDYVEPPKEPSKKEVQEDVLHILDNNVSNPKLHLLDQQQPSAGAQSTEIADSAPAPVLVESAPIPQPVPTPTPALIPADAPADEPAATSSGTALSPSEAAALKQKLAEIVIETLVKNRRSRQRSPAHRRIRRLYSDRYDIYDDYYDDDVNDIYDDYYYDDVEPLPRRRPSSRRSSSDSPLDRGLLKSKLSALLDEIVV